MIDIVVLGEVDQPVRRRGAEPGDEVWVTGELGGAAAAVRAWAKGAQPSADAFARFARPSPRIEEARWLARNSPLAAMIDISDGLAGDAGHLAAASGVRIVLEEAQIPVSAAARAVSADDAGALALALGGGEDYELCFVARANMSMHATAGLFTRTLGTRATRVGTVREGEGVTLLGRDGTERPLGVRGYSHFGATGEKP
jgi:thiamine-monophosphate kinase